MEEEKPKTGCQCALAGFCNKHNVNKSVHQHILCKTNPAYFKLWEECKGPGQRFVDCKAENSDKPEQVTITQESAPIQQPSLWQKAKNLASATATHITTGMQYVSELEQKRRLDICDGCEFLVREANVCGACGCKLAVKSQWASSSCPKGKW